MPGTDFQHQSNDAEISGHDMFSSVTVRENDNSAIETAGILFDLDHFYDRKNVTINISDRVTTLDNGNDYAYLKSDRMFALAGQRDLQGPVNYDIFLFMNHVCHVTLTWHDN